MNSIDNEMTFSSEISIEPLRIFADDAWVEEAARVSTASDMRMGQLRTNGGLIRRLMKDQHGTPFEFGGWFVFRVHAPIFMFREWQRHRVGWSYNEQSGRYTEFRPEFYLPPEGRPLVQTGKPMDYLFETGTDRQMAVVDLSVRRACTEAWVSYVRQIDNGIAKEVARNVLPVTTYSSMHVSCNPRSLMHFLSLRTEAGPSRALFPSHPQWEIRKGADELETAFRGAMPITWAAWNDSGRVAP